MIDVLNISKLIFTSLILWSYLQDSVKERVVSLSSPNDIKYSNMLQSQHVPILNMYSLLFAETANDMPFPLPETKYYKPF